MSPFFEVEADDLNAKITAIVILCVCLFINIYVERTMNVWVYMTPRRPRRRQVQGNYTAPVVGEIPTLNFTE